MLSVALHSRDKNEGQNVLDCPMKKRPKPGGGLVTTLIGRQGAKTRLQQAASLDAYSGATRGKKFEHISY